MPASQFLVRVALAAASPERQQEAPRPAAWPKFHYLTSPFSFLVKRQRGNRHAAQMLMPNNSAGPGSLTGSLTGSLSWPSRKTRWQMREWPTTQFAYLGSGRAGAHPGQSAGLMVAGQTAAPGRSHAGQTVTVMVSATTLTIEFATATPGSSAAPPTSLCAAPEASGRGPPSPSACR
jgi:hypothetical protein